MLKKHILIFGFMVGLPVQLTPMLDVPMLGDGVTMSPDDVRKAIEELCEAESANLIKMLVNRINRQIKKEIKKQKITDKKAIMNLVREKTTEAFEKISKTESKRRSLCKATGWRVIGFFTSIVETFIIAAVLAQHAPFTATILTATITALGDSAFKIGLQYLYERLWLRNNWCMDHLQDEGAHNDTEMHRMLAEV